MRDIFHLAGSAEIDLEQLRARLRAMSDADLRRFGNAARYMCAPAVQAKPGDEPRAEFRLQLNEACAEFERRQQERDSSADAK